MLNVAFLWIFSRGIELGVIVLCLLPIRALLRKKVPRIFSYLLWGALPVNIVYNLCTQLVPGLSTKIADYVDEKKHIEIGKGLLGAFEFIWTIGIIVILLGMLISYFGFYMCLIGSIRLKQDIYLNGRIRSPFTIGIFSPKIYLPTSVDEKYYESIILHEQVHIQRRDIWMKYLAVMFLAIFWFQPVLWLCYRMFINDMEEACDEAVIRKRPKEFRAEYARALLEVADHADKVHGIAIGYGNGEIKARIKNIVDYEKKSAQIRIIALVSCVLFMIVAVPISWQVPRMVKVEQVSRTVKTPLGVQEENTETKHVSSDE